MGPPLVVSGLQIAGDDGRIILAVERLHIEPGMAVGVRGPSGAGKSTLLFALAGLLRVAAGRISWGGTDLSLLPDRERTRFRRERIGMVFQDFLLFEELSASSNAGLAASFSPAVRRPAIAARTARMLERLGVPAGGRSVASFSGGERQRVAIARALAGDPAIILADEPTASLDRAAADRLLDDLLPLAREEGRTLIMASHDLAVQARMDRLIDIVDGRLQDARSDA